MISILNMNAVKEVLHANARQFDLTDGSDIADAVEAGMTESMLLQLYERDWQQVFVLPAQSMQATASADEIVLPELEWKDKPVLFDRAADTPPIPASLLPPGLAAFAEALVESAQVASALVVLMIIAVISTCLQKKFEISPYNDDYKEPVNVWCIIALPPASRKSQVVSILTAILAKFEGEQAVKLRSAIELNETERTIAEKRIEELKRNAAKEADAVTRYELIREITELKAKMPEKLVAPQLFIGDVTPEKMQSLLVEQGEKAAVISAEGGLFQTLSGLYTDGKANNDIFLQAHAGDTARVERCGRTAMLSRPAISMGLAVQPQIVAETMNSRHNRGTGLLARMLFAIPQSNIGTRKVGQQKAIPQALKHQYEATIRQLLEIADRDEPKILTLSKVAREIHTAFCQHIEERQGEGKEYHGIQDWTGKLPGAALRIAGLFHVVEHGADNAEIGKDTMERALKVCLLLIPHAQAAFDLMGTDAGLDDAKFLMKWITDNKQQAMHFRKTEAHRLGRFNKSKVDRLNKALEVLAERHIISKPVNLRTQKPTCLFYVNPKLFEG